MLIFPGGVKGLRSSTVPAFLNLSCMMIKDLEDDIQHRIRRAFEIRSNKTTPISLLWISTVAFSGSCHKRQKPQAPTPQAPIRNRQTRKVANAKSLNRNTNLT